MDRQAAVKLIRDTFESPFDKPRFTYFSKNLFQSLDQSRPFTYQGNTVPKAYQDYVSSLERIGQYVDSDQKKIDTLIVRLKKETSLEHARTMQRNFIGWYLNGSRDYKDAALVAFLSPDEEDWRFSLVKMEYSLDDKGKPIAELTPARRWSFLVGAGENSHTAQSQLEKLLETKERLSLPSLENAFNVEVVTKEFFKQYRKLFHDLDDALRWLISQNETVSKEFSDKRVDTVAFAKKLLGQVVFLYFLQKKGWLGVPTDKNWGQGDKRFLRNLFGKASNQGHNFFNDYLEYLFYEALARQDRGTTDPAYYPRFQCKIPFLNGGLFDPISNYGWAHTDLLLDNGLFSNRQGEGDEGTGILDIFDLYNFTVREDEPLEKEVAIDPEMLGKVFENLLEVKDRKSKGTYYTPREIVHYMCQESLVNYLDTALNTAETPLAKAPAQQGKLIGAPAPVQSAMKIAEQRVRVPREDIEFLVRKGELALQNDEHTQDYGETNTYTFKMPQSVRENAALIDEKLRTIRVCDPAIGSGAFPVGMMTEIIRARNALNTFLVKDGRSNYAFKREAIQSCLYGVDIDPGAVEIAKLRLWLSLVVDEENINQIQPLPNLDYKIVCGNSLMGVKRVEGDMFSNELEKLKADYFGETDAKKKQECREQIDKLIGSLTNKKDAFDFEIYFSEIFHEKGGFDQVIGNPPYVDSENMTKNQPEFREYLAEKYVTTKGNWDLYIPFWELSTNILNSHGCGTLITPNKWLSIGYGASLREYLSEMVYKISDYSRIRRVFENTGVFPVVIFVCKYSTESLVIEQYINDYSLKHQAKLDKQTLDQVGNWGIAMSEYLPMIQRIMQRSRKLGEIQGLSIESACTVSEAYELSKYVCEDVPSSKNKQRFKLINTGTIDKYCSLWGIKKTTYLKKKFDMPIIREKDLSSTFRKRYEQATSPKIIISGMRHFESMLDSAAEYLAGKSTVIIRGFNRDYSLKILLAILNSRFSTFFLKECYGTLAMDGGISFTPSNVSQIPIPSISKERVQEITCKVDAILSKMAGPDYWNDSNEQADVADIEHEIDSLVYQLYGLTPEEIAVVEDKK